VVVAMAYQYWCNGKPAQRCGFVGALLNSEVGEQEAFDGALRNVSDHNQENPGHQCQFDHPEIRPNTGTDFHPIRDGHTWFCMSEVEPPVDCGWVGDPVEIMYEAERIGSEHNAANPGHHGEARTAGDVPTDMERLFS
jgi:hypothetical protein